MILAFQISPDSTVFWESGPVHLNATIVFTWLVMALLVFGSWLATRKLSIGPTSSRWQNFLETIVTSIRDQIREVTRQEPDDYVPFLGTLFLFIAVANVISVVPGFESPTGSLTTTVALATCVFFAVPIYGVMKRGMGGYFRNYLEPTPFMLPFNIIGELSRTLALAVRLFGNIMSGSLIVAILLSVAPILLPVVMQVVGLLIGVIQAYIFAVLAAVYIASATAEKEEKKENPQQPQPHQQKEE